MSVWLYICVYINMYSLYLQSLPSVEYMYIVNGQMQFIVDSQYKWTKLNW